MGDLLEIILIFYGVIFTFDLVRCLFLQDFLEFFKVSLWKVDVGQRGTECDTGSIDIRSLVPEFDILDLKEPSVGLE